MTHANWLQRLGYRLLTRIADRLPLRTISDNNQPYLERYYIGTFADRRWYLHRFVGSDPQRGWHDHPWGPAYSAVLWGEYGEERCTPTTSQYALRKVSWATLQHQQIRTRRVRWWNRLDTQTAHRVVIGNDWTAGLDVPAHHTSRSPECWTLFCHPIEYTTAWGFWTRISTRSLLVWRPFDGLTGTARSGEWWNTAPLARVHPGRRPALTWTSTLTV